MKQIGFYQEKRNRIYLKIDYCYRLQQYRKLEK